MTADVSIAAALFAGVLSFLSPCVLPLVPPYLFYLAGTSIERLADDEPEPTVRANTVFTALLFVAGFSTVFVALGVSASAIGSLLRAWSAELSIVAGIVIILMGLHFLGVIRFAVLMFEKRAPMVPPGLWGAYRLWGAYAMGLAFAFGWTPCIGPILATILSVAASKETVTTGALLLGVYSAGLGIPFLLAALAVEPAAALLARFKRHLEIVEKTMGGLLVLTGIAFLFNFMSKASTYLLEWFPALGNLSL
jgi:cytochrome c-type biogenesis protein